MERKYIRKVLFALALILLLPSMVAEAKNKTVTVGKTYQMKLKGVSGKAEVKWKTSNKSVVSIAKRKGSTVTFKSKKKGTAVVTAVYKQKKYKCRVTVKEGMILSILVDTFFSRISLTMLPVPKPHNTACVLSWEEVRHWQNRYFGYSSN